MVSETENNFFLKKSVFAFYSMSINSLEVKALVIKEIVKSFN